MRQFKSIVFFMAYVFLLWSCSSEYESLYDGDAPIRSIHIFIKDADGENLLSAETEGNWCGQPFQALYDDSLYTTIWSDTIKPFDPWFPHFRGLVAWPKQLNPSDTISTYTCIDFGEFTGSESLEFEFKFFVPGYDIPYDIRYEQILNYDRGLYNNDETLFINGVVHKGRYMTITLPKREDSHDCENP